MKLPVTLALLLAGCTTTTPPAPIVDPVRVTVEVPVSCVPENVPQRPDYPNTLDGMKALLRSTDLVGQLAIFWSRLERSIPYENDLETIVKGCETITPNP